MTPDGDVDRSGPAAPGTRSPAVQSLFTELAQHRDRVVPVVGAGLSVAAGVPGATDLARHLQRAAGPAPADGGGLFVVADELAAVHGSEWVNEQVAAAVQAAPPRPTRTLRALARLPSRIIATSNYDDGISVAAEAVGLTARRFWGDTLNEGLRHPETGVVHVLHFHGHHSAPESLVLDQRTYQQALADEALAYALRQLAAQYVLVFLGQRLGEEEQDLRRDLLWAAETFRESGPHHILLPSHEGPRSDLDELAQEGAAIVVTSFNDPDGTYEVVDLAAQHLGLGPPREGSTLPDDLAGRRTSSYLAVPIAPADELAEPSQRAAWELAGSLFGRHVELREVLTRRCAVLFGSPGSGKTQTLLHAGDAADRAHVVYRALRDVQPRDDINVSAVDEFLTWVRTGSGVGSDVPDPTRDRLRDTVYLFLLDGLDEVRRDRRDRVLEIIKEVADAYPHQLFLLSSRPYHGSADAIPAGFDAFELVPDRSWFRRYVEHVGITDAQLARTLPEDAPLQDLVRLPIFAHAVVEATRQKKRLPESPVDAILTVARAGLERTTGLLVPVEQLDGWLDGLALIAEMRNSPALPRDVALHPVVAEPFGIDPSLELLDDLVQRALVVSTGGTVSFPATVVQEARAARALLRSPQGLELLRRHALITLQDGTRGVHPSWRHVVELAIHDGPREWRQAVAEFDTRLAARSVPVDADVAERDEALSALLGWYDQRMLWWIRGDETQLRNDLDVAVKLAASHDALRDWAVDWASNALDDAEPTRRGNALELLVGLGENGTVTEALPDLLADGHPVVRRLAAHAHATLRLDGFAPILRAALDREPDDLEERALLGEYARTAPVDELAEFLSHRWTSEMDSYRATTELDARFDRRTQLELLVGTDRFAEGWLLYLLSQQDPPWTDDEVRLLACHLATFPHEARRHGDLTRPVLQQRLAAAIPELWPADDATVRRLIFGATTAQLEALPRESLPDEAVAEIDELLDRRASAPTTATPARSVRPSDGPPSITKITSAGVTGLADLHPYVLGQVLEDHPDNPELRTLAETAWEQRRQQPEGPLAGIVRTDDTTIRSARGALATLDLAAHFRLPLRPGHWVELLELGWSGHDYETWLRDQMPENAYERIDLAELDRNALRQASLVFPAETVPADIAVQLMLRLLEEEESSDYFSYLMACAGAGRGDIVRAVHHAAPDDNTLDALVRVGDCDAELELLAAEAETPVPQRWSGAHHDHWLGHVRCESSVDLLITRIVQAEADDPDYGYLAALHSALRRTAGIRGLSIYDTVMEERGYETAPFLWFRRAELLDQLLAQATDWEPDDDALAAVAETVADGV